MEEDNHSNQKVLCCYCQGIGRIQRGFCVDWLGDKIDALIICPTCKGMGMVSTNSTKD